MSYTIQDPVKRKRGKHPDSYGMSVEEANLIIPDISGFTRFVHSTDEVTGNMVIYRLLSAIMNSNILGLTVAEIEGDAILFFKKGKRLSYQDILRQFEHMRASFEKEVELLREEIGGTIDLSLKLIAHYGPTADYKLSGFHKLYGKTVIAAHRLLKNKIKSDIYVLLTEDLLGSTADSFVELHPRFLMGSKNCKIHGGLRNISYVYLDYSQSTFHSEIRQ